MPIITCILLIDESNATLANLTRSRIRQGLSRAYRHLSDSRHNSGFARKGLVADLRGGVAVEFAILGPAFLLLLCGIIGWGGYFWLAHAVQQVTNDAARAALAGLDASERQSLATATVAAENGDYANLKLASANVTVDSLSDRFTVKVDYDAADSPFWVFSKIVPMPPTRISRQAAVRLGGY